MVALFALALSSFSISVSAGGGDKPPKLDTPPKTSVDSITPEELKLNLSFLASQEFGGRYTLSPQFLVAAKYLATRLESYGYKGAANGSFFQKFDVGRTKVDAANTKLSLTVGASTSEIQYGDFLTNSNWPGSADGKIVFVGYGISAPKLNHDDYAGLDVKGKIVLYIGGGTPKGIDSSRIGEDEQSIGAAKAHGAVGVMSLVSQRFLNFMTRPGAKEQLAQREITGLADSGKDSLPWAILTPATAVGLLEQAGLTSDTAYSTVRSGEAFTPKALDASAKFTIAVNTTRIPVQNVCGVIEGTDPKLKDEYVVFSAHYDHLQTNAQGQIYPGADDDGSGTVSVLAIARAIAMHPPKRSVLIMFHAGEELGLLGSEYNTDFSPVIPLDKLVVDLNIDMIGREQAPVSGAEKPWADRDGAYTTPPDGVFVVGTDRISKELHGISEQTNTDYSHLKLDYHYNNPNDPSRIYYRSDHWNYAKHGVPIIFYFTGLHPDYHQPTDTVDKIDFVKMSHIAQFVFDTGWRVANLDHRLAKDAVQ